MQALVKHDRAEGAILKHVPVPEIQTDEVLIQVKATSICGTDVHIYTWDDWAASRVTPPYVFGHEFSGMVVEVGENVNSIRVGDHVSAETHIVCGYCATCRRGDAHICLNTEIIGVDRDGCFAEYVALPARNVWKNDPELPFETASIMEPMGNAVHTALSGDLVGRTVAVMGCGPIGIMAVPIAKAAGAAKVIAIDLNPYRLQLAEKMGATHVIHAKKDDPISQTHSFTKGQGVDVVLEMSGHPVAIDQSLKMLTHGGRISMLGLPTTPVPVDITNDIVFKGITIQGITGRRMFETWQQTAGLLESGQVDLKELITHRFHITEYEEAFELMKSGNCGKIVFDIEK
nr:L-threonine 3-dehydrogenase [Polycladospora coralii]